MNSIAEEYKEHKITEHFLLHFVKDVSDILVIVVNILSFKEQAFIENIRQSDPDIDIFVIHNLYQQDSEEEIYKKIFEDIYNSFQTVR